MLELGQLVEQIGELARETKKRHESVSTQLSAALAKANMSADEWRAQIARIESAQTSFLAALPLSDAPIGTAIDAPDIPAAYTLIATDGSQIPLDRHAAVQCYVLNVGEVVIHYGTGERPHLYSNAELAFRDKDLFRSGDMGEASYVDEQTVGTRRMVAECNATRRLIEVNKQRETALALVDGTLILWAQEAQRDDEKKKAIAEFMGMLNAAREAAMPIAGYLSKSASREVVNALRITLCPGTPVQCKPCKLTPPACDELNRISDAHLFSQILAPGQRSGLFESQSKVIDSYSPAENRIAFYYVHVGSEIARVELPMWAALDKGFLDRTHALILDQAKKGRGYPVALLEAHEQAVVRGPERDAFHHLVENALIRNGLPMRHSRKSLAKRIGTV